MSTPPAGDNPDGDWPSHESGPPGPPPPPPGFPYGAYPPPPGYPFGPPQPPPPPRRISVGMVFVGALVFGALNLVIGFMTFIVAGSVTNQAANVAVGGGAVILALIAFGVGAVLLFLTSPHAKGIGLGLMIGWALMSVFTVGFCTGINPGMYTL